MEPTSSFGYWLRRRRKGLDLTQDELARQVGCAIGTLKKIETDERRPSKQLAERLADCLQLADTERAAFLKAARAELAVDRLIVPAPSDRAAAIAPTAPLPSGTVTFLFTDIEGSTRLWEQHPDAMAGALARHDAIVRTTTVAHGGVVFRTVGDAFCIAFSTATAACAAAVAAQRALTSEAWGVIDAVPVRMALHTCAAVPEDGDYRTGALNRLGRLLGAVHGGQIVLSRSTADLAYETLPSDVTLRDLGERHLRDLRPEPVFQLVAPDLPSAFPPLVTLDRPHHNLPAQPTELLGREQAIATICAMVRRTDVRHVTLTGPGGTGKTRVGLQVAAELLDDFANGVSFVDLAPLRDPNLVASTIAQGVDVREAGGQPLAERLKEHLRGKHLLLVLDNFEQVVDAAPLVGELLAAAPGLKVLVTSREPLHIAGEHEYAVPPLLLPDPQHLPPLDRLIQYEAIQLFLARAQAVKADFVFTNDSAPAIAAICQRLDGLPLAIELAAVRVKLLPPQALLARLDQTLKLLTGGARDAPARQQTMRATIDWSYHVLDAGEQTLFARLGMFVGGCTLAAAEAVCNADGDLSMDVLDGMAALVDKSLLKQAEGVAGEPRFTMLETLREYALERLAASGETEALRRRHADYFVVLVESVEPHLHGPDQTAWLGRLEQEYDNLRAVFAWSRTVQDDEAAGLRLAGALHLLWATHNHYNESRIWLDIVLSRPSATAPAARAKALHTAGALAEGQGEFARAIALQEESLALYRGLGDTAGTAEALLHLGRARCWRGEYTHSQALLVESLDLFRQQETSWGVAWAVLSLGDVALDQGDAAQALVYFEEALALSQGDILSNAWALINLGRVAHALGDDIRAQMHYAQCLPLFHEFGDRRGVAMVFLDLGRVAHAQRDEVKAHEYYAESLTIFGEFMDKLRLPECFEGIAGLADAAGRRPENVRRAVQLFGAAESLRASAGIPLPPVHRADYARDVALVRAQLDEATFAAAWAAGRALSLEQAIAYALNESAEDSLQSWLSGSMHRKPQHDFVEAIRPTTTDA